MSVAVPSPTVARPVAPPAAPRRAPPLSAVHLAALVQAPLVLALASGSTGVPVRIAAAAVVLALCGLALSGLLAWRRAQAATAVRNAPAAPHAPAVADLRTLAPGAGSDGFDRLTGVLSRGGLAAALALRAPAPGVLLAVDVTALGETNRRTGSASGDALLCHIAGRIARHLRPNDLLARWGGDEFVICLGGLDIAGGEAVAMRLRHSLKGDTCGGGEAMPVGVTVGVAPFRGMPGSALATAVREAEEEIHTQKQVRQRRVA